MVLFTPCHIVIYSNTGIYYNKAAAKRLEDPFADNDRKRKRQDYDYKDEYRAAGYDTHEDYMYDRFVTLVWFQTQAQAGHVRNRVVQTSTGNRVFFDSLERRLRYRLVST